MSDSPTSDRPTGDRPDGGRPTGEQSRPTRHTAGIFDIRNIIGSLLGVYGVVLVIVGLTSTSQSDLDKAGGIHVNDFAGLAMIVASAVFITWAIVRPVVVEETPPE